MKTKIKLAAINCEYLALPDEANPSGEKFQTPAPRAYVEANINKVISFMHEAGRNNVDLICTSEDFPCTGAFGRNLDHPHIFESLVEEIPGPTSEKLGEVAKQYGMYIAANYYEKDRDLIYNTSILIGRKGEIVGKYRKVHPADGERCHVTGSDGFPVFETDIGKIGFIICYDIIFPEHARALTMNGADILIHQTQGWGVGGNAESITGEAFMRVRAAENSVYLVVAKNLFREGGKSCIVDNVGSILARSEDRDELVMAEITPDFDLIDKYNFDNYFAGINSIKARQLLARRPSLYTILTDEKPPFLEKYKGMELPDAEKAKEIVRKWKEVSKDERAKYHW